MGKRAVSFCMICLFLVLCTGCSRQTEEVPAPSSAQREEATEESGKESNKEEDEERTDGAETSGDREGSRRWEAETLTPDASGAEVYTSDAALLDASGASEGYVILNYSGDNPKVKFQITTPEDVTYTYLVTEYGSDQVYPLPGGNGMYSFTVYELASEADNLYAAAMAQELTVNISDERKVFLYPNCYVDFEEGSACVTKGEELAKGCDSDLDVVASVYGYVTGNIVYDHNKAETVQSGYAPFPDDTLASGKGICFDYASLMSAMLRSQRIPTKLEVGYVGELYHAWISCYVDDIGWVDDIIEFDGKSWTMMDPTMAAERGSEEVLKLREEKGYLTKYVY